MKYFYLVSKNLTSKKLRLVLLTIAIMVAFVLYALLNTFQNAMNAGIELSADNRLAVMNKINLTQPLPIAYFNRVKQIEGVNDVAHMNWFGGYYQEPRKIIGAIAVSMDDFLSVYDEYIVNDKQRKSLLRNRQALLVGETVAKEHGWQLGDRIVLFSNIYGNKAGGNSWEFDVAAIYAGEEAQTDTNAVYMHFQYFNESVTFGENQIGWMSVVTESADINERVINDIDSLFANSSFETETMPEKAFAKQFIEQIGNIGLIVQSVVLVGFFTVLLLVGNAMMMTFRERTKEVAILKAIGFSSSKISSIVLAESFLLIFIGGVLGLLLTNTLITAINSLPGNPLPPFILSVSTIGEALIIMVGLGVVCGIVPAYSALKLNISNAFARE